MIGAIIDAAKAADVVSLQERRESRAQAQGAASTERNQSEPSQSGGSPAAVLSESRGPPGHGDGPISLDRELGRLPCTDLANVQRFVSRHGHRFKWCPEIGWLAWDQKRWSVKAAN